MGSVACFGLTHALQSRGGFHPVPVAKTSSSWVFTIEMSCSTSQVDETSRTELSFIGQLGPISSIKY